MTAGTGPDSGTHGAPGVTQERLVPGDLRLSFDEAAGWDRGDGARLPLRVPVDRLATVMSADFSRLADTVPPL
ncbi:hypothetical protein TK78_06360 [Streptomyces sp. Tue 6075]|uniref:hypothetical protein n=1 Tax=Streptomyces sp. Tue 6075 TaxID=1661694 RepID=UPI00094A2FA3|nr:hypothetical protein [Streptomyces sp. Tue 6075]APS18616.1 hypothetical protein TK78_06360 [Streptomyces sp. Tue 6075]